MLYMRVLVALGLWLPSPTLTLHTEHVGINVGHVYHRIDDKFIGVTIDSFGLRDEHNRFNHTLSSPTLVKLTQALAPAYLRVGGTQSDYTTWDPHATDTHATHGNLDIKLIPRIWDVLNTFVHATGMKLIFGLNVLIRKNGKWDPTNAESLIQYSTRKGYPIAGFELGNEPNTFHHRGSPVVNEAQLATDFQLLKQALQKTAYNSSLLLGPDTSSYKDAFIKNFLSSGGSSVVDVVTFHHYYFNGVKAKLVDFTNPSVLDHLKATILQAFSTVRQFVAGKPIWMGETSSAYAGGATNMSDRFVSGVLWMDKLGLSARYGIRGLMRQSLYGGINGLLINGQTPSPTYWITLLYKRMVGVEVFDVTTSSNKIRVYTHCTKTNTNYNYKPGSLTVYAVNLNTESIILKFPKLQGQDHLDVFWLTPENGDIEAENIQLNGKTLSVDSNDNIPPIVPKTVSTGSVTVPGTSYGFIIIPNADVQACKSHSHGTIIG